MPSMDFRQAFNLTSTDPTKLDHSRNTKLPIAVASICIILPTIFVALRLYTRHFILKRVGLDDYLALVSLALCIAVAAIQIDHTKHGLGWHTWDVMLSGGLPALEAFLFDFWLGLVLYNWTLLFIKLTLFFQFYRVIREVSHLKILYLGIVFVVAAWSLAMGFLVIFLCNPVNGFWDLSVEAQCTHPEGNQWINAIGNIVTDIIALTLPIPVVLRLQLERQQKWVLVGIFGLGFLTCIISVLRLVFLGITSDLTHDIMEITAWSIAELASGIICACLVTLRPLVARRFPRWKSSYNISKSSKVVSDSGAKQSGRRFTSRGFVDC